VAVSVAESGAQSAGRGTSHVSCQALGSSVARFYSGTTRISNHVGRGDEAIAYLFQKRQQADSSRRTNAHLRAIGWSICLHVSGSASVSMARRRGVSAADAAPKGWGTAAHTALDLLRGALTAREDRNVAWEGNPIEILTDEGVKQLASVLGQHSGQVLDFGTEVPHDCALSRGSVHDHRGARRIGDRGDFS
jgi:hypothetical protein